MKVVVITAITADRDALKENQNTAGADFVAFCDRPLTSSTWEVRPAAELFRDPVRNAKVQKILPHRYFPEHEYSLWIDGTLELVDPAPVLIERYLAECDVLFGRHRVHESLDDEVQACLREVLDDPSLIHEQRLAGGAAHDGPGFPLASAILRRHTPTVARFNDGWWSRICRWSRRDQLSLLDAAADVGLRWGYFPRSPELDRDPLHRHLGTSHFRWYPHGHGVVLDPNSPSESKADLTAPAWWARRLHHVESVSGQREAYALSLEAELANRTRSAQESERYARSLEAELTRHRRWARESEAYARSLEAALRSLGHGRPGGAGASGPPGPAHS